MQLALWTYEGPTHVGAMRIAASMRDVHLVLHAPQGDTYADLLFTMIERRDSRPPVTYTTFQARDLGGSTAELVCETIRDAYERYRPQALLVAESCTAELLQDQPGTLARGMRLPVPTISLELPAYSKKENYGAAETFYQLVRHLLLPVAPPPGAPVRTPPADRRPRANLLGPTSLGFRCRDDVREITDLLRRLGVDTHVVAPAGATPDDLRRIPEADFNVCLYPEVAQTACTWLSRTFGQPTVSTVPIGVGATREFVAEIARVAGIDPSPVLADAGSRLPWFSRSVDSTYLTGKRVFVFGDATHAVAAARIAKEELGFEVVGIGTYAREFARDVRACAERLGVEALIADDYLEVEARIAELQPELVLGTQMERHVAKRLRIPCAVISAPVHVQDFPARYSPQMGFEGANVIFDTWVHPLMMGLEEHLLTMFRGDFEFHDGAAPSHLGGGARAASPAPAAGSAPPAEVAAVPPAPAANEPDATSWSPDAERELAKVPFFVRGKARRNTERYARERGLSVIHVETLYDAKAHFGR
jgi:light-independent protochlorophyllide reductase subunit B